MVSIINKFSSAISAAVNAWTGFNTPVSFTNPVYYDILTPEAERISHLQLLFDMYDGKHKKHFKNDADNVILNYSRRIVNKGVWFLFGKPIFLELNDSETTPQEQFLDLCFESHELRQQLLIDAALNGGITGDFFIQISIDEDGIPKFDNLNPLTVFPRFEGHNLHKAVEYEIRWIANGTVYRNRHMKLESGKWHSYVQYQVDNNSRWVDDTFLSFEWPYDFPMIVHGRNLPKPNSSFGISDLEDADLNDTINLLASNTTKVSKLFSTPIVFGNGFGTEEIDTSKAMMSTDPQAKLAALQLTDSINSNVSYLNFLKHSMAEISSVPDSEAEKFGAASGFALEVIYTDLLSKTAVKRSLYGAALTELCRRALVIGGYETDNIIKIHWTSPLPVNQREQMESDKFDLEFGVASMKTIRAKRGYSDEQEKERIAEDKVVTA